MSADIVERLQRGGRQYPPQDPWWMHRDTMREAAELITTQRAAISALHDRIAAVEVDTRRLALLAETFQKCPHTVITWNEDADMEDNMGTIPLGYSIRINGCRPVAVSCDDFGGAIDALDAAFQSADEEAA